MYKKNGDCTKKTKIVQKKQKLYKKSKKLYKKRVQNKYSAIIYEPSTPTPKILRYTHQGLVDILTCEILALQKAVKYCVRRKYSKSQRIVIFSDNESAVKMIKGFYRSKYEFYSKIHVIRQIILKCMSIIPEIYHMHGHRGYAGNEKADTQANIACFLSQQLKVNAQLWDELNEPQMELRRTIKAIHQYTQDYWDAKWKKKSKYRLSTSKIHCQALIPDLSTAIHLHKHLRSLPQRSSKPIFRMLAGYCNLRFYQYEWNLGVSSPDCLICKKPETIAHYLLDCTKFDKPRELLLTKLRFIFLESNLHQVQPPQDFNLKTILTGDQMGQKYTLQVLKALSEYIGLNRVKL